jgi:hypothetical protein
VRNELEPGSGTFELRRRWHLAAWRSRDRVQEAARAAGLRPVALRAVPQAARPGARALPGAARR